jgi:6-phosphogluconolactonase
LDWARVQITLVDERWVDPGSEDSNENLVRRYLLRDAAAAASFIPLKTEAPSPDAALIERSAALPAPLDIVVLGMGPDGHTASLFPGAVGIEAALDPAGSARLAAIIPPQADHPRLGLTLAELCRAGRLYLQIQGLPKLAVYTRACGGDTGLLIGALMAAAPKPIHVYLSD